MAFGELGIDFRHFYYRYTWPVYQLKLEGYIQREERLSEERWLQTRELMYLGYNTNVEAKYQKSRHELLSLPSDPENKVVEVKETPEQRAAREERFWAEFDRVIDAAEGKPPAPQRPAEPDPNFGFFNALGSFVNS